MQNTKLDYWKVLIYINLFLLKRTSNAEAIEELNFTERTCVDWRSFCSEVTQYWFKNQKLIGGEGVTVEIERRYRSYRSVCAPLKTFARCWKPEL